MPRTRLDFHELLKKTTGLTLYFQSPPDIVMTYPCIRYALDSENVHRADDIRYLSQKRYLVTIIDYSPDSIYPQMIENLPYTRFDRFYVADNLNHFVYSIYF